MHGPAGTHCVRGGPDNDGQLAIRNAGADGGADYFGLFPKD